MRFQLVPFRIVLTVLATMVIVIIVDWSFNLPGNIVFTHRSTLSTYLAALFLWSLLLRLVFQRVARDGRREQWCLLAAPDEVRQIHKEWVKGLPVGHLFTELQAISLPLNKTLDQSSLFRRSLWKLRLGFVIGSKLQLGIHQEIFLQGLADDGVAITSIINFAEDRLERSPPALIPENWLLISDLRWSNSFSVQRQLKRATDVFLAICLMLLFCLVVAVAGFLIWIEDRGPIFMFNAEVGLCAGHFV